MLRWYLELRNDFALQAHIHRSLSPSLSRSELYNLGAIKFFIRSSVSNGGKNLEGSGRSHISIAFRIVDVRDDFRTEYLSITSESVTARVYSPGMTTILSDSVR
jgi:hypothetical protein